jgi:hypothetical protein
MADKTDKKIAIRMGQGLHDWYVAQADELGVPTSSLMVIALNEYRKVNIAVNSMPGMMNFIKSQEKNPNPPFVIDLEK